MAIPVEMRCLAEGEIDSSFRKTRIKILEGSCRADALETLGTIMRLTMMSYTRYMRAPSKMLPYVTSIPVCT